MKPYKILLYLIIISTFVLIVAQIFPDNGVRIGDKILLKFHFSFLDKEEIEHVKYADIHHIIENNKSAYSDSEGEANKDTIISEPKQVKNKPDTLRIIASKLNKKIYAIEYPNGDTSLLFSFFKKLKHSSRKRVRILHYGDSQLEGDRITGYLRNKFQKQFGGSGPGLLPLIEGAAESASIKQSGSHNWVTHSLYYKQDTILPHRKFGILGRFYRFTGYCTNNGEDTLEHRAYVEFSRSEMAYRSVNNYAECRIFYGNCISPITVKGFVNDKLIWFEDVDTTVSTKIITWNFDSHPDKFKIEFEGSCSPDVYGVALDAHKGVSVDNLPFRGSSGTEFTKFDYKQYKQMGSFLNAGLIIVQFGVNVVPYGVKSYKFYQSSMIRQLRFLQKVFHAPVLVVGVSDMSYKVGNYYKSYASVVKVKEAQRLAAKRTGCAYWDLYSAMGGENSMPSWVFANPPLAQKDFTHFNRRGGHIVAQMLYNAIMQEYEKFNQ